MLDCQHACFQTTYEELKHLRFSEGFKILDSFQTTYEELKLFKEGLYLFEAASASRLPMRNWNRFMVLSLKLTSESFQTTYEELKLEFCGGFVELSRFQTTYEELKLIRIIQKVRCLGFQTTYEELKLRILLKL